MSAPNLPPSPPTGGLRPVPPRARLTAADALWAPLLEGGLMLAIGAIALGLGRPLLFASLGPTAYEQMEQPQMRSARFYNVLVGHLVGLGSGFFALWLLHAWNAPKVLSTGLLTWTRVGAALVAIVVTTVVNIVLKAQQPSATSTTLLVSLGAFQDWPRAQTMMIAFALIAVLGEPLRRFRLRQKQRQQARLARPEAWVQPPPRAA